MGYTYIGSKSDYAEVRDLSRNNKNYRFIVDISEKYGYLKSMRPTNFTYADPSKEDGSLLVKQSFEFISVHIFKKEISNRNYLEIEKAFEFLNGIPVYVPIA